ncbi:gamma carbonic anhydrase family protein [Candidatus Aenigmatarchaeota archaeon]
MIESFQGKKPKTHKTTFVHKSAQLIGDVTLKEHSSVWCSTVLRADAAPIIIGKNSNIQDNCSLHVDTGLPVMIGENVTVAHNCVVHSSTIGNNCIIGIGAILLNNSKIGNNCIIGAGAVVLEDQQVPDNSIVLGIPGKVVKKVNSKMLRRIIANANEYVTLKKKYMKIKNKK